MAWLVSVCYALADFALWRLVASAYNVSLYGVRQHEDVRIASDREGATEGGLGSKKNGGKGSWKICLNREGLREKWLN